ncbi:MAG: PHP domain-containing protein [Thermoanaerobaculia bacterium]
MRVDLHTHSSVSDGLDSPAELVRLMSYAGIDAFALTDHDTLQGLPEAREEAQRLGVEVIAGAEISANFGGSDDIHILALFVDEGHAGLRATLSERQEYRRTRGERMARKLIDAGYAIDLVAIRDEVGGGVWGRPHLARALVRAGYATDLDNAFDRFLGHDHPWYVPYEKWPAVEVVHAVREAGGVSSLAHAVWYPDVEGMVRTLAAEGLDAMEVFHPDHGPEEEARFGALVRELGLAATAGSDFHGAPEGRKHPGGVWGDAEMLGILRARAQRE